MHAAQGSGHLVAGRYRLVDQLGRGAMGIVWSGRDELLDRDVAVKQIVLAPMTSEAEAEASYQRTLREARIAARLSHPGVVTVFDVVEENGTPWIVMEMIRARPLDQVIAEDGPLPPAQAAQLGLGLLDALASAHAAGVLHRDVKPSNVLISPDGKAVLTDFGIAMIQGDPGLTQIGMVVGTPGFAPPERVRGAEATTASDMWSLGATLYAAVEGRGPFDRAGGSAAIVASVATEAAPRAPSAGPLAPVIEALLRFDPAERPDATSAARMLAGARAAARSAANPRARLRAPLESARSSAPEAVDPVHSAIDATTATQVVTVPGAVSPAGVEAGRLAGGPARISGMSAGADGAVNAGRAGAARGSGHESDLRPGRTAAGPDGPGGSATPGGIAAGGIAARGIAAGDIVASDSPASGQDQRGHEGAGPSNSDASAPTGFRRAPLPAMDNSSATSAAMAASARPDSDAAISVVPDLMATPVFAELKMPELTATPGQLAQAGARSASGPGSPGGSGGPGGPGSPGGPGGPDGPAGSGGPGGSGGQSGTGSRATGSHGASAGAAAISRALRSKRSIVLLTSLAVAAAIIGIVYLAFPGFPTSLANVVGGGPATNVVAKSVPPGAGRANAPRTHHHDGASSGQPGPSGQATPPGQHGRSGHPGPPGGSSKSGKPSPSGSTHPSPSSNPTASPSANPSPTPTPNPTLTHTLPTLPKGYVWQSVSAASVGTTAGFRVGVPANWTMTVALTTTFKPMAGGAARLRIDMAPFAVAGPYREAHRLQANAIANRRYHAYHLVSIVAMTYHGHPAATWSFWFRPAQALNRTDVTEVIYTARTSAGPQPFVLSMAAPAPRANWADNIFKIAMRTFRAVP